MSAPHRHRTSTTQPQLPLPSSPAPAPATTDDRRPGDWHLDERTRRLGRDGVAAARALLGRSDGADDGRSCRADNGGPAALPGDEDRRTGRAA